MSNTAKLSGQPALNPKTMNFTVRTILGSTLLTLGLLMLVYKHVRQATTNHNLVWTASPPPSLIAGWGHIACGHGMCGAGKCGAGKCGHGKSPTKTQSHKHIQGVKVLCPIQGMTCTGCEKAVANRLTKLGAVRIVDISYQEDRALLIVDTSQVQLAQIEQAIRDAGFQPQQCTIQNENQ